MQGGEGVALVLRRQALAAWRLGVQQWKAWSSRCVCAVVQVDKRLSRKVHLVSCYAPTRTASREDKDAFFQELESIIFSVPSGGMYVILGDFNARVGSRDSIDGEWSSVREPHGFESTNDSARELLAFLAQHQATVCNTWFRKKDIHKQTWPHPKSKQWSCIYYVMIRQQDRRKCLDVAARRGAENNTDHNLVHVKLRLIRTPGGRVNRGVKSRRSDVEKLRMLEMKRRL